MRKGIILMAISYEGLRKLIEINNISKTDFKNMVGISTVTLAKLSKNEPVSLSTLENICEKFHCRIEDIVTFTADNKEEQWSRIEDGNVYFTELFYLYNLKDEQAPLFLYGYSVQGDDGLPIRRNIQMDISCEKGNLQVWKLTLVISGSDLISLILCINQHETIGTYMEKSGLHLSEGRNKKNILKSKFPESTIGSLAHNYRSPIILFPGENCYGMSDFAQPLHAFGDEILLCESLICSQKDSLYKDYNGNIDPCKMEIVYDVFKQEGFLINGFKDICRIGDFELFYPLVSGCRQEDLFNAEALTEQPEYGVKILKGFIITVFSKYLSGDYSLDVTTLNAGNPTSSKHFDITIKDADVCRIIELPESSSSIVLQLYEKNENNRIQLVGYDTMTLIRDIYVDFNIKSSSSTLEDNYTRKLKDQLGKGAIKAVNTSAERYSSSRMHIGDDGNDPWRNDFLDVEQDFNQIYGSESADSVFLNPSALAHEAFLKWLKACINKGKIKKVWIFDPYIDGESLPQIIRVLADNGVKVVVVTDANAQSRNKNRIDLLKICCEQLEPLLQSQIEIYALNIKGEAKLHDRMILMFGGRYFPDVYNLSNSLDNMGMNSPSVICKLKKKDGYEAAKYYLELYTSAAENNQTDTIYKYDEIKNSTPAVIGKEISHESLDAWFAGLNSSLADLGLPCLSISKDRTITCANTDTEVLDRILDIITSDAVTNWHMISYCHDHMNYELAGELKKHIIRNYSEALGDILQKILSKEIITFESKGAKGGTVLTVSVASDFREVLDNMGRLLDNCFDWRFDYRLSSAAALALEILMMKDFRRITSICEHLEEAGKTFEHMEKRRLLLYNIAIVITEGKNPQKIAEDCLNSGIDYLIAIGMQWFIKRRDFNSVIPSPDNTEYCHEFFRALIIDLQVEDCQRKYRKNNLDNEEWQEQKTQFLTVMNEAKSKWVDLFSSPATSEQMKLYFDGISVRGYEDICDLLRLLYESEKLSQQELDDYLFYCLFCKANDDYKKEKGYWVFDNFKNGELLLNTLTNYGDDNGHRECLNKMAALEKKLLRSLHDVFLRKKNYTKWKCYIDMLMWSYAMRLICMRKWADYSDLTKNDKNLSIREKEITGLLKKYQTTLEKYSDAYLLLTQNFNVLD